MYACTHSILIEKGSQTICSLYVNKFDFLKSYILLWSSIYTSLYILHNTYVIVIYIELIKEVKNFFKHLNLFKLQRNFQIY